jgi:riboflavin synthase
MFTGIIEKTLRIIGVTDGPKFRRITLPNPWTDVKAGDSIAINGCCLTVAELDGGELAFDVIQETLGKTNLGQLQSGQEVHAERALRIGDRLDGHFVQGHIDGTATLVKQVADAQEWRLTLEAPDALVKYLAPKGSITLDGIALTLAAIRGNQFDVALIPTTINLTALAKRPLGWPFNLECDILAKTIVHYLEVQRH